MTLLFACIFIGLMLLSAAVFWPLWQVSSTAKSRLKLAAFLVFGVVVPCLLLYELIGAWPMMLLAP